MLLPIFFSFSCTEQSVQAKNASPTAQITSHEDGAEALEGYLTLVRGTVSDPDNDPLNLTALWYLGPDEVCRSTPDADGITSCEIAMDNTGTITLEVRDPQDAAGVDSVTFNVTPTEAPTAEIHLPVTETVLFSDAPVSLEATVSDAEDNPETLSVWWESSLDGLLPVEGTPDSVGLLSGSTYLSEGVHTLTVWAEDSTAKLGSASVSVQVGAPNQPPECSIISPTDNTSVLLGQQLAFEGLAEDPDGSNDSLLIEWYSDKDGLVGNSLPDSAGAIDFSTATLSNDTHTISMRAADAYGATCIANVVIMVSTPPSIELTSPLADTLFPANSPVLFTGMVSDGEDPPAQLAMQWTSDVDGEFSTQGPDSTGEISLSTSQLSMGAHLISATVTDSSNLYDTVTVPIRINTPPSEPSINLGPTPADTTNTLSCQASSSDPDGQTVGYTYQWYQGSIITSYVYSTLPSTATAKNQIWTCMVTPDDGLTQGPTASASITIQNSPPVITSTQISPGSSVNAMDTLSCVVNANDADAEALTSDFVWTSNGNTVGTDQSLDLANLNAQYGDTFTCTATVTDSDGATASNSATATVSNVPPSISTISLSPTSPDTNSLLTVAVVASDPEGDPITLAYQWRVNGVLQSVTGTELDGNQYFSKGDFIAITVTPSDPTQSGTPTSATTTILNSAPTSATVAITPNSPIEGQDDLICEIQSPASDADGDNIDYIITWEVDGVAYPFGDTASPWVGPVSTNWTDDTIPASDTIAGEQWTCTITPTDGTDDGISTTASAVIQLGLTGWYWNGAYWYTSPSVGWTCDQLCSSEGLTFDQAGSQHSGNQVGTHFWPSKNNGSNWVEVECSSTDNNTNWGANGGSPSGTWSHPACHVNCACQ